MEDDKNLEEELKKIKWELKNRTMLFNVVLELLQEIPMIERENRSAFFSKILSLNSSYLKAFKGLYIGKTSSSFVINAYYGFEDEKITYKKLNNEKSLPQITSEIEASLIIPDIGKDLRFNPNEFFNIDKPTSLIIANRLIKSSFNGIFVFYLNQTDIYKLNSLLASIENILDVIEPHYNAKLKNIMLEQDKLDMNSKIFQTAKLASLGTLAAGIAHEINNPLTIINGNAELIEMYYKDEDFNPTKFLEKIIKSVDRIRTITNGLRNYTRGDIDPPQIFNIHTLIQDTLNIIDIIFQKQHITIEATLNAQSPEIFGNMGRLQQVFMNLLVNAKDALENKTGKISITTLNKDDYIEILFSDTGCGIPPEDIPKIFTSYHTTKQPGKGTGLGLSISQTIIDEMNGTISVTSELNKGTTFTIVLPGLRHSL